MKLFLFSLCLAIAFSSLSFATPAEPDPLQPWKTKAWHLPKPPAERPADKPDVVIVLCDDLNPFYLGFAGDPDAKTPNLDAIARESARFTRCYTASPVCMPARTGLVTGLYPHNTGCWGNATAFFIDPGLTSMFTDLKIAGYTTSVFGKAHWFSGAEFKRQFDSVAEYFAGIGIDNFEEVSTTASSRSGSGVYQDFLRALGKFEAHSRDLTQRLRTNQYVARPSLLQPEETSDWMTTEFALDLIRHVPRTIPFATLIGYSNPHSPMDPSGRYAEMYDPQTVSLRKNVKDFQKYGADYNAAEVRKTRCAYLGKISLLDDLVGRLVAELKQRGTWQHTILVFTSDHGLAVGEHGNIAKGSFWEEVARVPMLLRIPGLTDAGMESAALTQMFDLYPTVVEAVGGAVSPNTMARSLLTVLTGKADQVRDAVFCEIHHGGKLDYMARDGRYKWFRYRGEEHLYDLEADPFELTNRIDSPDHRSAAERLRERLRRFLMEEQVNYSAGYKPVVERLKEATPGGGQ